jgi:DNA polymerase III epsilon subunit family exonuclease
MIKKPFVVLDLETTGLNPVKDQIIEIGAVKFDPNSYEVLGEYHTLVKLNEGDLPANISMLTGIRREDLESGKSEEEAVKELVDFVGNSIILGHHLPFDLSFIARYHELENDFIDTKSMAYMVNPNVSTSLKALCKRYEINNKAPHRALNDARATWLVFHELFFLLNREESEIWTEDNLQKVLNTLVIGERGLRYVPYSTEVMYKKVAHLIPFSNLA